MKKYLSLLLLFVSIAVYSQQHVSVSVDDNVYRLLESAQTRNLCSKLPSSKPYAKSKIVKALKEILKNEDKLYVMEKDIVVRYLNEYTNNLDIGGEYLGRYRLEKEIEQDPVLVDIDPRLAEIDAEKRQINFEVGGSWKTEFQANMLNSDDIIFANTIGVFLAGDLSTYLSYNFEAEFGILQTDVDAYGPFQFDKSWTGYLFNLKQLNKFEPIPESWAASIHMETEISMEFLENTMGLRFGRIRHDWGIAEESLVLSAEAQPFVGMEGYVNPFEWINFAFITGVLEYDYQTNLKVDASSTQNAYSLAMIEFNAKDWFHFAFYDAVVWPKRFELGYAMPTLSNYIYQNCIGDFDNMQIGFDLGFSVPGYIDLYYSMLIDEADFTSDDFFHKDRNMYAWQLGLRLPIPKTPFTTLTIQYTKIEPYMYTHPAVETPWYDDNVSTAYLNHGESLGFSNPPNSDELLVRLETMPFWFLNSVFEYRMIRHGVTADGSEFSSELDYTNLSTTKYFLQDGIYEWFHQFTLGAEFDALMSNVPLTIGVEYSYVFQYYTDYENSGDYSRMDLGDYSDTHKHLISLWVQVY